MGIVVSAGIGLSNPKTPANVGSALRAAGCYGASMVAMTGQRYRAAGTDVAKMHRHIPLLEVDDLQLVIPHGWVPVAVEILPQSVSLFEYQHPQSAFYVFGPEDGTLGAATLKWCRDVIHIPTNGCLNLAMCVNTVLYDRAAKQSNIKRAMLRKGPG